MLARVAKRSGMESLTSVFGRRIKLLREAAGMTQEQLGKSAGVDYKHVGAIERGEKTPSFEAVERLAHSLKADYYELFLPHDLSTGDLDKGIRAIIRDIERLGTAPAKQCVNEVLAAVRKMTVNMRSE